MQPICNHPRERILNTLPWVVTPNLFSDFEIVKMNLFFESSGTEAGMIGGGHTETNDSSVRSSNIKFHMRNEETDWIFQRINRYVDDMNFMYYNFDLYGYESIQYTEYSADNNGHYDFHQDTFMGEYRGGDFSAALRKLSVVVALTQQDVDFSGGDFEIATGNQKDAFKIKLNAGDAVIFPSFMLHRVAPITSGKRKSLVTWVIGPRFK